MPYTAIDREQIEKLDKVYRLKLINSLTGYKSANLVGTASASKISNLTVFSSVTHFGSHPPLVGFVTRPTHVQRDTYNNILENNFYTINHIHTDFTEKAHQTSASCPPDVSEFATCGFDEEYLGDFPAPFVKQSTIKYGLKLVDDILVPINGTRIILGEVQNIFLGENILESNGNISLTKAKTAAISGLESYYQPEIRATYPFLR